MLFFPKGRRERPVAAIPVAAADIPLPVESRFHPYLTGSLRKGNRSQQLPSISAVRGCGGAFQQKRRQLLQQSHGSIRQLAFPTIRETAPGNLNGTLAAFIVVNLCPCDVLCKPLTAEALPATSRHDGSTGSHPSPAAIAASGKTESANHRPVLRREHRSFSFAHAPHIGIHRRHYIGICLHVYAAISA